LELPLVTSAPVVPTVAGDLADGAEDEEVDTTVAITKIFARTMGVW
jgi:hypothetical protein